MLKNHSNPKTTGVPSPLRGGLGRGAFRKKSSWRIRNVLAALKLYVITKCISCCAPPSLTLPTRGREFYRFCGKLVFFISILFACPLAHAEMPAKLPAPIVAIVDVQRIMEDSLAAQSTKKQLDAQRSKFQTEIEGEENELRQAEQTLAKERTTLPAQTYSDHEQQLRQRFSIVENNVQSRRKALDQAYTDSVAHVRSALLAVVDKVAHEHGANIVIIKQQTLWIDMSLDITDEVLKRLDKNLPKVDVVIPAEKPAP